MIDMHTHILYGIDDGAEDIKTAIDLLKEEWNQGVQCVVLTPHYGPKFGYPIKEIVEKKFNKLCDRMNQEYPYIQLYLGSEIYYHKDLIRNLQEGNIPTINNTKYVLIEFAFKETYFTMKCAVQELIYAGYIPIIAHIERYQSIFGKYNCIQELIDAGAYIQVNMESFLGGIFNKKTSFVKRLLKMNLVQFIASDCHDLNKRKPNMEAGKRIVEKHTDFGKFMEHASKMLKGEYI